MRVKIATAAVLLVVGCAHPQPPPAAPEPAPVEPAATPAAGRARAVTAPTAELSWGETSGSCDSRPANGECADLQNEPRGADLCPDWGGNWSTSPCPPPDWGSCFMGGGQVTRYYRGETHPALESARDACGIQGGTWSAAGPAPAEPGGAGEAPPTIE